jgi:hypothetical protein
MNVVQKAKGDLMSRAQRRIALLLPVLAVLVVCFQNCAGDFRPLKAGSTIDMSGGIGGTSRAMKCDPSLRGTSEYGTRRLTKKEIVATLKQLIGPEVMNNAEVVQSLGAIPEQTAVSNEKFNNLIQDVEGLEAVADKIATLVVANASILDKVLGGCNVSNLAQCKTSLVDKFAYKAFRRPVPAATKTSINALVDSVGGAEGLKLGIARVLVSPYFHQLIELGENSDCGANCAAIQGPRIKITQYEVASRLAFQLTGAGPDVALLDAAAKGQLGDLSAIKQQAQRLLALPVARENWRRITTEWLGLRKISDPNAVIANDFGIPADGFGAETLEELMRFSEYEVFEKKGSFRDLITDQVAIPFTDRLAKVYGVPMSSTPVKLANGMGGLIARPAAMMSPTTLTSPILRGVFIQKKILCREIPDPDPNAVNSRIADTADFTHDKYSNRDVVTQVTNSPACISCHNMINPVGFSLEGLGPLGAPRKRESVFDQSRLVASHAINTSVANINIDFDRRVPSSGSEDTLAAIADSSTAKACFNRVLLSNTRYRAASENDGCLINETSAAIDAGQSITEVLVNTVVNEDLLYKSSKGL